MLSVLDKQTLFLRDYNSSKLFSAMPHLSSNSLNYSNSFKRRKIKTPWHLETAATKPVVQEEWGGVLTSEKLTDPYVFFCFIFSLALPPSLLPFHSLYLPNLLSSLWIFELRLCGSGWPWTPGPLPTSSHLRLPGSSGPHFSGSLLLF